MTVNEMIKKKNISKYRLAKDSGIPYTTINDICKGKVNIAECSAKTIYKLSKELEISMEELVEPYMKQRPSFELFKSNVCHRLKEMGDIEFLISTLNSGNIIKYYEQEWYPESLYLLAMVDYISRENDIPLCDEYSVLRGVRLKNTLYPASVITAAAVSQNDKVKEEAKKASIPEFIRFNIVESEVRNIV